MNYLFTEVTTVGAEKNQDIQQGYLAVSQGKISYLGTERPEGSFSREISCEGKVLMAGLVNAPYSFADDLIAGHWRRK